MFKKSERGMNKRSHMASNSADLDVNKLVRNIRLQTLGKEPELDVPTPFE